MLISEIFYSVQGEGTLVGTPSVFIRTSGCNLRCRWCDTPYASWKPEGTEMGLSALLEAVQSYPARFVVVTGGEPMIAREMPALLSPLRQAGKHITLEGQEKDVTTAGLARMNMILHDFPTANVQSGNTLANPKFLDGPHLRTYDYVVANPPFSDKTWSTGLNLADEGQKDPYQRFSWGLPPAKQGDYAYLLHIVRSI